VLHTVLVTLANYQGKTIIDQTTCYSLTKMRT